MGTWSHEPFGNDDACDWAYGLAESEGLSLIEESIGRVLEIGEDYLEADVAEEAVAAAEVLAKLLGRGTQRDAYTESIDQWVAAQTLTPSAELRSKAQQALAPDALMEIVIAHSQYAGRELDAGRRQPALTQVNGQRFRLRAFALPAALVETFQQCRMKGCTLTRCHAGGDRFAVGEQAVDMLCAAKPLEVADLFTHPARAGRSWRADDHQRACRRQSRADRPPEVGRCRKLLPVAKHRSNPSRYRAALRLLANQRARYAKVLQAPVCGRGDPFVGVAVADEGEVRSGVIALAARSGAAVRSRGLPVAILCQRGVNCRADQLRDAEIGFGRLPLQSEARLALNAYDKVVSVVGHAQLHHGRGRIPALRYWRLCHAPGRPADEIRTSPAS